MHTDRKLPPLVGLQEAADILGISKQAAHKRATKGQLPGAKVGDAWVFRRLLVETIAAEQKAADYVNAATQ